MRRMAGALILSLGLLFRWGSPWLRIIRGMSGPIVKILRGTNT